MLSLGNAMNLLAFGFGTTELIIFMIVVVLIFGSARLPGLMRSLGRSLNEFKAGTRDPVAPYKIEDQSSGTDSEQR